MAKLRFSPEYYERRIQDARETADRCLRRAAADPNSVKAPKLMKHADELFLAIQKWKLEIESARRTR